MSVNTISGNPTVACTRLLVRDNRPVIPDRRPVIPDRRPVVPDRRPVVPDRRPVVPDRRPVVPDRRPVVPDCPPVVRDCHPVVRDNRPVVPAHRPVVACSSFLIRYGTPQYVPQAQHEGTCPNIAEGRRNRHSAESAFMVPGHAWRGPEGTPNERRAAFFGLARMEKSRLVRSRPAGEVAAALLRRKSQPSRGEVRPVQEKSAHTEFASSICQSL
jgi:hypothetical protein